MEVQQTKSSALREWLLVVAAFMVITAVFSFQILATGLDLIPGDTGDARFNHYLLEHSFLWLKGSPFHTDLFSPPIFFPSKNTLGFSDLAVGGAIPYWILRACGVNFGAAFPLWILISHVLNATAAFYLLRRILHFGTLESWIASAFFAFAAPRFAQLCHAQLIPQYWIILSITGLALFANGKRPKIGAFLFGFGWAAQLYCGFYHFWFYSFGLLTFFGLWLMHAANRSQALAYFKNQRKEVIIAAAAAATSVPAILLYASVRSQVGKRTWNEVTVMLPRVGSWLYTGSSFPFDIPLPMAQEHVLSLGILTPLLAIVGLWISRKRPLYRIIGILITVLFFGSLMIGKWSLWYLVYKLIPGASAVRAVTRISLFLLIPLSIGIALSLRWVAQHCPPRFATYAVVLLGALLIGEQLERALKTERYYSWSSKTQDIQAIANMLDPKACFYAAYSQPADPKKPLWETQLDAVWAGLIAGVPTVNGYSGNYPANWDLLINSYSDAQQRDDLIKRTIAWSSSNHLATPCRFIELPQL